MYSLAKKAAVALVLFALASHVAQAVPPQITKSVLARQDVNVNGAVYKTLSLIVDFDQPLFIKSGSNVIPVNQMLNFTNNSPLAYSLSTHIAKFECFNHVFTTDAPSMEKSLSIPPPSLSKAPAPVAKDGGGGGGPTPGTLMLAPSTEEPGPSFISLFSSVIVNETQYNNRIALMIIYGYNGMDFVNVTNVGPVCRLNFTTPSTPGYVNGDSAVMNANGEFVNTVANFTQVIKPHCTSSSFAVFKSVLQDVLNRALGAQSTDELGNLQLLFTALQTRSAFSACQGLLNQFFQTEDVTISIAQSTGCTVGYNDTDPAWYNDPCCNGGARFYSCCAPRNSVARIKQIQTIDRSAIAQQCSRPGKITPMLLDFVNDAIRMATSRAVDAQAEYDALNAFTQGCYDKVYNQPCTQDSQCKYGPKQCLVGSGTRYCAVNWGEEGVDLANCYVTDMPVEVRYELKYIWGLSAYYNSTDDEVAAIAGQFQNRLYTPDCTGPNSWNYKNKYEWVHDVATNTWTEVYTPGNQTACLAETTCNYDGSKQTQEQCLRGSPNFCGRCQNGWCFSVTQEPRCEVWSLRSSSDCQTANGTWDDSLGWPVCLRNLTALETCLTPPMCQNLTQNNNWACSSPMCYNPSGNETGPDDCNTYNQNVPNGHPWPGAFWNTDLKKCIFYNLNNRDQCLGLNYTYFEGRFYRAGRFYTQDQCAVGICDNPTLMWQDVPATPAQCTASRECTQQCKKCESRGGSYNSLCLNTTASTQQLCNQAQNSQWLTSNGMSVCAISTFANDPTQCVANNLQFATCQNATRSTCQSSPAQGLLNCFWNTWATCTTSDECMASGTCDDYDFANHCDWEGCSDTGVCYRQRDQLHNDNCNSQNSERWTRYGCIVDSLTNSTMCQNAGPTYTWVLGRAQNHSSCDAYGMGCKSRDFWGINGKNASECALCNGQVTPLYTWTDPQWVAGQMLPLQWTPKTFASVNKWQSTIDYNKLSNVIAAAISRVIGRKIYNDYNQRVSTILPYLERVACECTGAVSTCADTIVSRLGQCLANPGQDSQCNGLVLPSNLFSSNTSAQVDLTQVPCSNFVNDSNVNAGSIQIGQDVTVIAINDQSVTAPLRKRDINSVSNSATYAVIRYMNVVVGQLIGNGLSFTFSQPPTTSFELCLDVNSAINQDTTTYPKYDFAMAPVGSYTPGSPLNLTAVVRGLQLCANVTGSGTYFPILTKLNYWANIGSGYSTTPGAATTTTATTAPSTPPKSVATLIKTPTMSLILFFFVVIIMFQ